MGDMTFDCPECGKTLQVDESGAGRLVNCPECSKQICIPTPSTVPAEPQTESSPSSSPQLQKACPFCGESILAVAKKCKHCGEFLDGSNQTVQSSKGQPTPPPLPQPNQPTATMPSGRKKFILPKSGSSQTPTGYIPQAHNPMTPVCLSCGYQGAMHKKYPTWVIVCAIGFFPLGLLFLCAGKRHKCPKCGEMQNH
jgi:predicted RNA-binding Zn-ribbon protein involved in translation (DUF1610 family)